MDHVRVGGVCLLLLIIALALPINALAQTPQPATSSASENDVTASDSASIISQSLSSESSAQAESISAETMAKRSTGLKPLGSSGQSAPTAASNEAAGTGAPAQESNEQQAETGIEAAPAAAEPIVEEAVTPDMIETEPVAEPPAALSEPAVDQEALDAAAIEPITPPEDAALGMAVPEENATETVVSQNASFNDSTIESENATEEEVKEPEEEIKEDEGEPVDRIWREGISPYDYTWDYRSFSGFFYDMKNDVGTEKLNVKLQPDSRNIDPGNLIYNTDAKEMDYEFGGWGEYQVIGFMAEKYFAGYLKGTNLIFDEDFSLINEGELRKVLVDSDDESTITTGSALTLEEGYELRIKQIDIDGNKVYLGLNKDGEEIDSKVVSPGIGLESSTYRYEVEISGEDQPIIMAHISNVFRSTESDLVTVDGVFQISDTYASVEVGDSFGEMEVTGVSDVGVEMKNDEDTISLKTGDTAEIFGDVGFLVADAEELRFAPVVEKSGPQELRGTVINPSDEDEFTWTVYNFEGFYYDIDDDIGTETLTARIADGSRIEDGDLLYSTSPASVEFEYGRWGEYDVIGFMADKYFAGYNNLTRFTDEVSVLNEEQLRKILIDSDDSETIATGSALSLEEGYELRIKQVDLNGNKVYFALAKDGEEVDSKVVTPSSSPLDRGSNYMYEVDVGSEDKVPIITAHVESVFRSTESDLATVDAIFQVSDSPESVKEGEVHGEMEVEALSDQGITMLNDGSISLTRDRDIEIMDGLIFRIADSDERLMAPITFRPGEESDMTVSVPETTVDTPVTISVKSGSSSLSGAEILLNGSSVGSTDATGSFTYTPTSAGTSKIVAKKTGYNDGQASLVVRTAAEASEIASYEQANVTLTGQLTLNAPAEVVKGENFLISVVQGINRTPVEEAGLFLDNVSIGSTGSQGTMAYFVNGTGEHTLKAEKEGFDSDTKNIMVASALKVAGLTLPEKAYAGSEMMISANVRNTGSLEDSRLMELKANDTVVDSKNATVKGGENITISFIYTPTELGPTKFSLDEQSQTINVEEAKSNIWLIALILVLLIAIGAGYYLYSTGELNKLQREVKRLMQGR
jgi:S-layer protein (TIGR01567 family)